ncbi:MAG: thioredoxin domain-containing protein, partial [Solirubrobacterales bacterium]
HFEKMLYDNALLARAYLHGWQVRGHERWREISAETLDWALREMRGPEGGFYSALDADSEGEEGRFYTWSLDEARETLEAAGLADLAGPVIGHLGITEEGNFEGRNILHLPGGAGAATPVGFDRAREALLARRDGRVRPGLDDKRLCSWNALMIGALADAGAVLGRDDYLDAARLCAEFVWTELRGADGRLRRSFKDGRAPLAAYLEDYSYLLDALLTLYEASFEARWFDAARQTADQMIELFADPERGGFFTTTHDHERLIARRKDVDDHPIPSGNSAAAYALLRLAELTGDREYERRAFGVLRLLSRAATTHPHALAHLLRALDFHLAPTTELALAWPAPADGPLPEAAGLDRLDAVVRSRLRPHMVLAGGPEGTTRPELMAERTAVDGSAAAYVCERFACRRPITEPDELAAALDSP